MCGIAGFIDFRRRGDGGDGGAGGSDGWGGSDGPYGLRGERGAEAAGAEEAARLARGMADAILYRGPDDAGVWVDAPAGVAFGHRRLSIVDLSEAGHQPMHSRSGRFVVVYNGEIYNHLELRGELASRGAAFRGHSDTEVLLAAVEEWGVTGALQRLDGMFAIALWDRAERHLYLARDRFGEKPLYYGLFGGSLLFGSELKALRAHPLFDAPVDRTSLTQYLRFGYVPTPGSIFAGVRKLPPASWLRVAREADAAATPKPYWSLAESVRAGAANRFTGSDDEAVLELDRLLRASIRRRMIADVPLGAFLSGGIDSSTVVALMQAESRTPVRTFTIGFHDEGYDEAATARAVAGHLGTHHTELYVTPEEAQAVIPRLPALYDEPFADSSQIPTFLVAGLARRDVTVALSGDGGDELFGGYNRYFWAENVWSAIRAVPRRARRGVRAALLAGSPGRWDGWFESFGHHLPAVLRQRMAGDKIQKIADLLGAEGKHDVFLRLASAWKEPASVVRGGRDPTPPLAVLAKEAAYLGASAFSEQMMFADTLTYLPDDILTKVDRATMGVSLEGRMPLLDPALAAFAWRLPPKAKVHGGKGKWPLRRLLSRYLPAKLFERPKMGFGIPIGRWLRGPLRAWAESLLDGRSLEGAGFFDPAPVRAVWSAHLSGARNHEHALWAILMFQAWLGESAPSAPPSRGVARVDHLDRPNPGP